MAAGVVDQHQEMARQAGAELVAAQSRRQDAQVALEAARAADRNAAAARQDLAAALAEATNRPYGATRVLSTSYAVYDDRFEVDPASGAAWTKAGVDTLQAGVEVVA